MDHITAGMLTEPDRLLERIRRLQPPATDPVTVLAVCPECGGTKWKTVEVDGVNRVIRCDCLRSKPGTVQGLPAAEVSTRLADIERLPHLADALRHADLFVGHVHPGLFIWGPPGTGKTKLAAAILNELAAQDGRRRLRFVSVLDLLQELTGLWSDDRDTQVTAEGLLATVSQVDVLVLDDIGTQKAGSDYARRTIQLIIDRRLAAGVRTIWTSNCDLDELAAQLDDRITSRIVGHHKVVECDGPDYRLHLMKKRARR